LASRRARIDAALKFRDPQIANEADSWRDGVMWSWVGIGIADRRTGESRRGRSLPPRAD
jgi:hypothetical protein